MTMQKTLADNLARLAKVYVDHTGYELSTVGAYAVNDPRFFLRLGDGKKSFTVRKYDQLAAWFSNKWPEGLAWPAGIDRPIPRERAATERRKVSVKKSRPRRQDASAV